MRTAATILGCSPLVWRVRPAPAGTLTAGTRERARSRAAMPEAASRSRTAQQPASSARRRNGCSSVTAATHPPSTDAFRLPFIRHGPTRLPTPVTTPASAGAHFTSPINATPGVDAAAMARDGRNHPAATPSRAIRPRLLVSSGWEWGQSAAPAKPLRPPRTSSCTTWPTKRCPRAPSAPPASPRTGSVARSAACRCGCRSSSCRRASATTISWPS